MAVPNREEPHDSGLIAPLVATAIVGTGSIVTLALSVLTMKAYAIVIGPTGVGLLALLQSTLNVGVIVATAGLGTSAIGSVASAAERGDAGLARTIGRSALVLGLALGLSGAAVFVVLRNLIADVTLGSHDRTPDILWLAPAVLFSVAAIVQVAVLSGHRKVKAVTAVNIGTGVASTLFGVSLVLMFGDAGLAPSLLATAVVSFGLATVARRRVVGSGGSPRAHASLSVTRDLLALGLPVAASQVISVGMSLVIPVLVLQSLGPSAVGHYRAAAAISIAYGTVFAATLTYDYFPRVAASWSTASVALVIEGRMRIVLGLGTPLLLGLLATGPIVIEVLYAPDFRPALSVLQWQLIGDVLRLPALVLWFALIAQKRRSAYFVVEGIGAVVLGVGTLVGLASLGLEGTGVAYAVTQVVVYIVAWVLIRRRIPTTPGRLQAVVLIVAGTCAALVAIDVPAWARSTVFALGALSLAALSWRRLFALHRRQEL